MKAMMDLKELLEEEIAKIVKKGDVTPTELERLDDAVDIIKDITTICAMEEYDYQMEEPGYSGRYPRYMRDGRGGPYNGYRRGYGGNSRDYMMDPRYYEDSYNRGGSYGREDMYMDRYGRSYGYGGRGYSGHTKEELKQELIEMMGKAATEKERMAIQQVVDQWKD